jgi:hypothetical protein
MPSSASSLWAISCRNAETGARIVAVGHHVRPRKDHRPGFPRLPDQFVLALMQHPGGIHVAAGDAERIRIDDQLRPAAQAGDAEFQQWQAAQRGEHAALPRIESVRRRG